jgi:hypothetical protein
MIDDHQVMRTIAKPFDSGHFGIKFISNEDIADSAASLHLEKQANRAVGHVPVSFQVQVLQVPKTICVEIYEQVN